MYKLCSLVEQIWVYGNSFESVLVAVIVPHKSALLQWAAEKDLKGDYEVGAVCDLKGDYASEQQGRERGAH